MVRLETLLQKNKKVLYGGFSNTCANVADADKNILFEEFNDSSVDFDNITLHPKNIVYNTD